MNTDNLPYRYEHYELTQPLPWEGEKKNRTVPRWKSLIVNLTSSRLVDTGYHSLNGRSIVSILSGGEGSIYMMRYSSRAGSGTEHRNIGYWRKRRRRRRRRRRNCREWRFG